jgi:hypothetical protein
VSKTAKHVEPFPSTSALDFLLEQRHPFPIKTEWISAGIGRKSDHM